MKMKAGLVLMLLFLPVFRIQAQTNIITLFSSFDIPAFPQWAKDMRRWEIVAFGSYPFTMFAATFAMDTYRWAEDGMDWSDTGRRYAPWPLKSAGAIEMDARQYETVMTIAAGMSVAIAIADLIIVQIKRHKARQRTESLPVGTTIIIKKPWPVSEEQRSDADSVLNPDILPEP